MKYITFTIPCYNSENYMRRCVDSLLVGGEDVEILIIDDGSSDRTGAIADEYEMLYPNIVKAVHKPNGGHGSGVNKGLELAHGLYYKVVDSDDWFDRDAYLKMLDKIKSFEVAQFPDLIICNYVYDHLDEGIQKPMNYRNVFPTEKNVQLEHNRTFSSIAVFDYACTYVSDESIETVGGKTAGAHVLCG